MSSLLVFNRLYVDWRYVSRGAIFDPSWELLPLYLLSDLPHPPPLPKVNLKYLQKVCGCEGGWGVELCYRPFSAGV
jgi:hypothetical protein